MGMAAAAVVALGAVSAISSVASGNAQSKSLKQAGEYNAQVYEQQAEMINQQKKLQEYKDNRMAARIRGATTARVGKGGFLLSGSPLALMVDNETQMQLDKEVGQYNLDIQRNYALSGAEYSRYTAKQQAKLAKSSGFMNAFSSILKTASFASFFGKSPGNSLSDNTGQSYSSMMYTGGI